ncbi:hypothetical protein SUGI_0294970 [Cryptomeria japonica]|uniref:E3 ubiquitin-protein ligase ATL23 n=1 Tax=Cryptomeria japonica TaxID=3369 RepID=UPI002408EAD4|nr:E3 ubiquitin-protein ligase ATL23 [Cryptomeria japonica]GLJ17049.1 hypothetical protein SUGI_0294970 [Cryptomeria japonica]
MVTALHTIEKRMWEALLAFLMLCGGSAVMVLLYMWFAWYASLYAMRLRADTTGNGGTKNGLSVSDIQKLPTFICTTHSESLSVDTDGYGRRTVVKSGYEVFLCEDSECTVCLEQFKDGERCLLMPICRHCFHVDCAKAWLSKQPHCPVCRTSAQPKYEPQQKVNFGSNQHAPDAVTIDVLSQE